MTMNAFNQDTKPKIGFIGMGHMGSIMALRLLDAGYPLSVYDRKQEHTQPLMYKDFELILHQASELSVPMPTTAVAQQVCAMEHAKDIEENYSAIIQKMEELAGL
ncbi:MAG: NAD(P)-binding domain-containing protein [Scytonema sp. PMC 1069.18]|nr:NAD(P)-binding domain-containing protein [Scytonema sp. PMC 1069.18]MEC4884766.1 NAD(P)-binding domain-containing protein [Scytonema sp. PMC 1070.18]